MNILLIIVLLILVFCTINGLRRGVLGIIYGFVSWIFILVFVIFANPYIEDYLRNHTQVYTQVVEHTQEYLLEKADNVENEAANPTVEEILQDDEEGESNGAEETSIDKKEEDNIFTQIGIQLPQMIGDTYAEAIDSAEDSIVTSASEKFADFVLKGIAVLLAFLIAQIAVWIVGYIVRLVGEIPVVHGVNGFFGLIAGAFQGLLYIWIGMYIIAWISTSDTGQILLGYINQNEFLTYLYQHNLIITILENF